MPSLEKPFGFPTIGFDLSYQEISIGWGGEVTDT